MDSAFLIRVPMLEAFIAIRPSRGSELAREGAGTVHEKGVATIAFASKLAPAETGVYPVIKVSALRFSEFISFYLATIGIRSLKSHM
ncbi:hypothetical protein HG619_25195 [Pseudomonas syringae]|nr:hypothetical protein [Pseudomonas syringae]